MDETLMLDWIDRVWKPHAEKLGGYFLLILDQFEAHMTSIVQTTIVSLNTTIVFIPAGHAAKLQVLDVGINKPFKDYNRREFKDCIIRHVGDEDTPTPHRRDVSNWASKAWKRIKKETILNTWKHVGIGTDKQVNVGLC